ncbi:N-acetylneuraminate synthase [uncultured Thalassospira sp.]|uniref:N-acetylneuraminate synthase n=1 Tax=uncultured Thalassospira sp. TaxID=404382 RepID=UPI0025883495|nr:N-acetylneuraminate synthase [uncultured Thalassospira sp.]
MHRISPDVFIIAEAGVNHNGSLENALALVDVASSAGADAVKFQTFRANKLVSPSSPKAQYQIDNTGVEESQQDMLRTLELSFDDHIKIEKHCRQRGIIFLSTPFDSESLHFLLQKLHLSVIKIPSGELTNGPYLLELARTGKPLILSTGAADINEVRTALYCIDWARSHTKDMPESLDELIEYGEQRSLVALKSDVSVLHCVTAYPAPFEDVNLQAMDQMKAQFGLPVGLSDHTIGIAVAIGAVARGASIIEKHFTLDRNMPGPDHAASLEPSDLRAMIEGIRQVSLALGQGDKVLTGSEVANRDVARRSLFAACEIPAGTVIQADMLQSLRPGTGLSPMRSFDIVGRPARKTYQEGQSIED